MCSPFDWTVYGLGEFVILERGRRFDSVLPTDFSLAFWGSRAVGRDVNSLFTVSSGAMKAFP